MGESFVFFHHGGSSVNPPPKLWGQPVRGHRPEGCLSALVSEPAVSPMAR